MIIFKQKLQLLIPTNLNTPQCFAAFGTRSFLNAGAHTPYGDKIERKLRKLDLSANSIVYMDQVHSDSVSILTSLGEKRTVLPKTDGVITSLTNVVLTVRSADCVPLLLYDEKNRIIAASHQGWRGTLSRLPQKMVKQMVELGANISKVKVAIGPSIGLCCYEVTKERSDLFKKEFNHYPLVNILTNRGSYLNLPSICYSQLLEAGVNKSNICFFPFCTSCDKKRFFSYRRDSKVSYGEMISFIMMKNPYGNTS